MNWMRGVTNFAGIFSEGPMESGFGGKSRSGSFETPMMLDTRSRHRNTIFFFWFFVLEPLIPHRLWRCAPEVGVGGGMVTIFT